MQKLSGIYSLTTKKTAYHIEVGTNKPAAYPEFVSKSTADFTQDKKSPLLGLKEDIAKNMKIDRSQSDD
jgi:hypothetical protein